MRKIKIRVSGCRNINNLKKDKKIEEFGHKYQSEEERKNHIEH